MAIRARDFVTYFPKRAASRTRLARAAGIQSGCARRRLSPSLVIGSTAIAIFIFVAIAAPLLVRFPYDQVLAGGKLEPPSLTHPFGTDTLGRDMLSRVLYGARIALGVALAGIGIAAGFGIPLGLFAGYRGGWVDQVLSRLMDVWLAFPSLLLALVIVSRLGPSLQNTVIALGIASVPSFYRVARSSTMSIRHCVYIQAAQSIGASESRIIVRHILPNLASPLIIIATIRSGTLLLATGGLSFIGLGAQLPLPEWGAMLASGRTYLDTAPWLAVFPGICITAVVAGINLFGDGLRDLADPHRRTKGIY